MAENIIDLKSKFPKKEVETREKADFEIHHISENEKRTFIPKIEKKTIHELKEENPATTEKPSQIISPTEPSKTIEVSFTMFSELISNPNSKKIINENSEEIITLSANLLTKLASATEEKNNNKLSIIFCIGLIIGITFAWVLLNEV